DRARHVRRAGRRVVDRALPRRRDPLAGLRGPAEHGRDSGAFRLQGERAADRAEADDAELGGAHAEETSRNLWRRKREGRPSQAALTPRFPAPCGHRGLGSALRWAVSSAGPAPATFIT